jgi:kynurenine formamidase
MHFPAFGKDAANYLIKERQVEYLGIDTLSLDPGNSKDYSVHTLTLAKGLHLIENLDALDKLPARGAILFCGPLRIKNGTGSPAHVVALLP